MQVKTNEEIKEFPENTENIEMRLEVLVACPPTAKCKQVIRIMEKQLIEHPGKLKLDIYYAGMQLNISPTAGFQNEGKFKKIPSIFVNGIPVPYENNPSIEEDVSLLTQNQLNQGAQNWQR